MIKKLLLLPLLLFSILSYGQGKTKEERQAELEAKRVKKKTVEYPYDGEIKITKDGIGPVIVIADSLTASAIYERVKDYVIKTYKNPDVVIKVDEPNKIIRFEGYSSLEGGFYSEGTYRYTCQLEFKEGRYRISFFDVHKDRSDGMWVPQNFYDDQGELRSSKHIREIHNNMTRAINIAHEHIKISVSTNVLDKW